MRSSLFVTLALALAGASAQAQDGGTLFLQKCAACHTIGDGHRVGPDLLGVTTTREPAWLERWIREPDRMIAEKDPTAMALLAQFNQVPMPNLGVTEAETKAIVDHIARTSEARKDSAATAVAVAKTPVRMGDTPRLALVIFLVLVTVIASVFWMIARSTRDPVPAIDVKAAYRIRKVFFMTAALILLGVLVMTLTRTPYADRLQPPDRLVYVAAKQFAFVYSQEPVTSDADLGRVTLLDPLEFEAGDLVEFRVTSLDVTHDFALYNEDGSIVAQTQAMPGYVNRLRVRLPNPGRLNVFCLEYCGAAHQVMRSALVVR